jgi:hypothetical protein
MYIRNKLGGVETAIVVRPETEARLRKTCFRGKDVNCAGNFFRWGSSVEVFDDSTVRAEFLAELADVWRAKDFGTHSVTIRHEAFVGWSSTAVFNAYAKTALEPFKLNRRASGLRVKTSRTDLSAPRTADITLVFEFKAERSKPVAVVHSIYPGEDVGELVGDVSSRELCVFYDFNHPGA